MVGVLSYRESRESYLEICDAGFFKGNEYSCKSVYVAILYLKLSKLISACYCTLSNDQKVWWVGMAQL